MASKKEKAKKSAAKSEQPAAPAPTPVPPVVVSDEIRVGYESWLLKRTEIDARWRLARAAGEPAVAVNYDIVSRNLRGLLPGLLADLPAFLARLSPVEAAVVEEAASQIEPLANAARFVGGQHESAKAVGKTKESTRKKADREELMELRRLGLRYGDMCVTLDLIDAEEVANIKAGSGLLDAAQDNERIGLLLKLHLPALAPALALVKKPEDQLTAERVDRMIELGGQVAAELKMEGLQLPDALGVAWKEQRVGVSLLLDERWDKLRHAAIYHYNNSKKADVAAKLHPLKGLQR